MHRRARTALRSFEEPYRICRACRRQLTIPSARRYAQLQATPSVSPDDTESSSYGGIDSTPAPSPDAQFEILGHPYSLLSVKLSPSQNLYSRRGSLVAVQGKPEDVVSTLSVLGPLRRSLLGIPFLYQRISSTSSMTALVSTKSAVSSFSVVHLDGRLDWIVAQRSGLLAWTGHSLAVTPKVNTKMSLAHWGNTHVTGRGLVALVGKGQIYSVNLKANESYVVHPSAVLAYTVNAHPPQPYRFKSGSWRLQVPRMTTWIPDTRFFQTVRQSQVWKAAVALYFTLRTWARRTIWGDRLFMQFQGPMTILLQSRGASLTDVLTNRDVNEIAEAPVGAVRDAVTLDLKRQATAASTASGSTSPAPRGGSTTPTHAAEQPTKMRMAVVRGGRVDFS